MEELPAEPSADQSLQDVSFDISAEPPADQSNQDVSFDISADYAEEEPVNER